MSEIRIKYGEGEIIHNDDQWCAYIGDIQIACRAKLSEAKKAIDQHGDNEKKLERHLAIKQGYRSDYTTVTVTSYPESSWRGPQAWVTFTEGTKKRREMVDINSLYEDTPKNHVIISEIKAVGDEIEKLQAKKASLQEKLQQYQKRKIQ